MRKISLAEAFAGFAEHWSPKIAGELNGQHVKLVKFQGDFDWHRHTDGDELFLVVLGAFRMDYRDGAGRDLSMELAQGEFVIVPRGIEHRPSAAKEVHVLLFEPAGMLNTGDAASEKTVQFPDRI